MTKRAKSKRDGGQQANLKADREQETQLKWLLVGESGRFKLLDLECEDCYLTQIWELEQLS